MPKSKAKTDWTKVSTTKPPVGYCEGRFSDDRSFSRIFYFDGENFYSDSSMNPPCWNVSEWRPTAKAVGLREDAELAINQAHRLIGREDFDADDAKQVVELLQKAMTDIVKMAEIGG